MIRILDFFSRLIRHPSKSVNHSSVPDRDRADENIAEYGTLRDWYQIQTEFVDCHIKFRVKKREDKALRPWLEYVAKIASLRHGLEADAEAAFAELFEVAERLVDVCENYLYEQQNKADSLIEVLRIATSLRQHANDTLADDSCTQQVAYTQKLLAELELAFYEDLGFRGGGKTSKRS